eukprot:1160679-Pelagomonas_calceolata.AAC.22
MPLGMSTSGPALQSGLRARCPPLNYKARGALLLNNLGDSRGHSVSTSNISLQSALRALPSSQSQGQLNQQTNTYIAT